jgi:histone demethylase JARID1
MPKKATNFEDIDSFVQKDPVTVTEEFQRERHEEVIAIHKLRNFNQKRLINADLDEKFCICNQPPSGVMLRCHLCFDWFHHTCVLLPKTIVNRINSKGTSFKISSEFRFLCCNCLRTRRPRLDTILSLLMTLQKLPVRVPEGEALQFLTERAMNWQDRAKQMLSLPEIQILLEGSSNNALSSPTQRNRKPSFSSSSSPVEGCSTAETSSLFFDRNRKEDSKKLGKDLIHELEKLMVEGNLLEVSLDEIHQPLIFQVHELNLSQVFYYLPSGSYQKTNC